MSDNIGRKQGLSAGWFWREKRAMHLTKTFKNMTSGVKTHIIFTSIESIYFALPD